MALARDQRDSSQTLLAAHANYNLPTASEQKHQVSSFQTTHNITSRPSTAASQNNNNNIINNNTIPFPRTPFIVGHNYASEWTNAKHIEAARLRLVPRNLTQDSVGPMSYPLREVGYEKLSTSKGRPFGGEIDQSYANFVHHTSGVSAPERSGSARSARSTSASSARRNNNNNNSNFTADQQENTPRTNIAERKKVLRGVCTFGSTPRMTSAEVFNDKCKSAGRPTSATAPRPSSSSKPRSQQTVMEKKYGPLKLGLADGTSLPGAAMRKVDVTPAAGEYDVRRATPVVTKRAPCCSFGSSARFDLGAEASALCHPKNRPATASKKKFVLPSSGGGLTAE